MCKNCDYINSTFSSARNNPNENYLPILEFLQKLEQTGEIEMYAGDCNLSDSVYHIRQEVHFTVCQYFQCKTCKEYIFIGACIRGTPIYELRKSLKNENLDERIWGKVGTYFKENTTSI